VLLRSAIRRRWVSPELQAKAIREVEQILDHCPSTRQRLAAVRLVLCAAAVDAQNEAADQEAAQAEAQAEAQRSLDVLRQALTSEGGPELLLSLQDEMISRLDPDTQAPRADGLDPPGALTPLDQVPGVGSPCRNGSAPEPGPAPTTAGRQGSATEPPPTPPPERRGPLIIDPFGEIPRW
jgi:hypothetical protein